MTFNSGEFLIFFPITLLLYFILPKKWSRYSLLMMSLIFYLAWNVKLVFLILFFRLNYLLRFGKLFVVGFKPF